MNKNNNIFKNAVDNIHASENLKKKTLEKMEKNKHNNIVWGKFLATCAMVIVTFSGSVLLYNQSHLNNNSELDNTKNLELNNIVAKEDTIDMPRFENIDQLKAMLSKGNNSRNNGDIIYSTTDSITNNTQNKNITEDSATKGKQATSSYENDYSKTNTQVEDVDEADIVKTDGNYIYYISKNVLYIINSSNLNIISKLDFERKNNEYFNIQEIFLNNDKLVLLGNYFKYETKKENSKLRNTSYVHSSTMAQAIVYNIKNKENPKEERQVALDGYYTNARMIGDNVYFISNKPVYYYDGISDNDILPILRDTNISEEDIKVKPTDIAYFENSNNHSYMMCAGFNINNNNEAYTDIVYGASDIVYASENNLYTCYSHYKDSYFDNGHIETVIFKFALDDSKIKLKCTTTIDGDLNDQFSMDEYNGNLRVAATTYSRITDKEINKLYVFNENLETIGKIDEYAKGENIYSVRFIGNIRICCYI